MLGRQHHRVDAVGGAVGVVFHRHLALGVRTHEGQLLVAPHLRVVFHQTVRQINRQRHQAAGLVAGETEHHPLVARATRVHTHRDVSRLRVDVAVHLAGVGGEADRRVHIADLADGVAHQLVHDGPGQRRPCGDLTRHHRQVGRHHRLACHPALGIMLQAVVQDRVADLVGNLVRVPHRYRLAGEQIPVTHGNAPQTTGQENCTDNQSPAQAGPRC